MSTLSNNMQLTMVSQLYTLNKRWAGILVTGLILLTAACSNRQPAVVDLTVDPILHQAVFKTPEDAANSLVAAISPVNEGQLRKILGADYPQVIPLDDVTREDIEYFTSAWDGYNTLLPQGDKKMLLAVGKEQWVFPIPITASSSGWYYDIEEGIERMRIRRIGRNELATMQAVLAYYDAQMEYAEQDHNANHRLEYAQKFISTEGTHDGLYWEVKPSEALSPLGKLLADRTPSGGYHGYFYRILNAQGESARGGAYSYLIGNNMRAGFGLIAWPEEYGESGIMSFIVSHAGIVYEKNLGADGASIAKEMQTYNPDSSWIPTKEVSLSQKIIE